MEKVCLPSQTLYSRFLDMAKEVTRKNTNDRAQHSLVRNLKGQKPLPAIPPTDNSPNHVDISCNNAAQYEEFNARMATTKISLAGFNSSQALTCDNCELENSASLHSPCKHKWVKSSQQLMHMTRRSNLVPTPYCSCSSNSRSLCTDKLKRKHPQRNLRFGQSSKIEDQSSPSRKYDQTLTLFIKNSKYVKQLPPISAYNCFEKHPFRPTCPTPVSPPPSPQI